MYMREFKERLFPDLDAGREPIEDGLFASPDQGF